MAANASPVGMWNPNRPFSKVSEREEVSTFSSVRHTEEQKFNRDSWDMAADDVAEDEAEEEEEPVDEETRKQLNKARAAVGMEPLAS